jgi:hypothetical protein
MGSVEVEKLVGVEQHLTQVIHGLSERIAGFDGF